MKTPSIFGAIKTAFENKANRLALENKAQQIEFQSLEAAQKTMEQAVRLIEPENDGYVPVGLDDSRSITEPDQQNLRDAARDRHRRNPHMCGYIRTLERFVVGRGTLISPVLEDKEKVKEITAFWKMFRKHNNWDFLENEIPRRLWRDGEFFLRKFSTDRIPSSVEEIIGLDQARAISGMPGAERLKVPEFPDGMRLLRLVPPEHITDPVGGISHGILSAANDVQNIIGYLYCPDGKRVDEIIPAEDMVFMKIGVDSDIKRGRTILEPLLSYSRNYDDWLKYRIALNIARSAVVLTKKVKGTNAQINTLSDAQQTKRQSGLLRSRPLQMLRPLSTITHGPDVEYEFKSPQLQAQDAQHDGRAILLTMAAGTGMPEFIMTGDSSNSNYASTLVSEGPALREFLFWQDVLTPVYASIYRWAIEGAVEAGVIKMTAEELAAMEILVEWPPLESRNILEHAQANEVRFRNSVISREGFARSEGIDWGVERNRLDMEEKDSPSMTIQNLIEVVSKIATSGALVSDPNLDADIRKRLHLKEADPDALTPDPLPAPGVAGVPPVNAGAVGANGGGSRGGTRDGARR